MTRAASSSLCEVLDWDSTCFGLNIGRVKVDRLDRRQMNSVLQWCRRRGVDCLYLLAASEDAGTVRLAEAEGFRLVDLRVTLGVCLPSARPSVSAGSWQALRRCQPGDIPRLRELAGRLHTDSRFFFDDRFPRRAGRKLFEAWMDRDCRDANTAVFVAEQAGVVVGYVTCHAPPRGAGRIQLIGVEPRAGGRGLGGQLVAGALAWFQARAIAEVRVVTQGRNARALRLYGRHGFLVERVQLWYHKWWTRIA